MDGIFYVLRTGCQLEGFAAGHRRWQHSPRSFPAMGGSGCLSPVMGSWFTGI
jgi:transposase